MALKRVSFATAHNASEFTSARWNFQPVPDGFGNAPIQLVEIAPGNPRFAYDPATGEPEGLLIEEQRTNYIANTLDPDRGTSGTGEVIITPRTETVFGVECTVLNVVHTGEGGIGGLMMDTSGVPSSQTFAPSFFVKNISNTETLRVRHFSLAMYGDVTFTDIPSDGRFHRVGVGLSSATITHPFTTNEVNNQRLWLPFDGGREFEICLPQLEAGDFATSPIITSGTAVTRTADIVARTLGAEFNPSEGTFVVEFEQRIDATVGLLIVSNDAFTTTIERVGLTTMEDGGVVAHIRTSGSTAVALNLGTKAQGRNKAAISFDRGNLSASLNGGNVSKGSVTKTPDLSVAIFGATTGRASTSTINGTITQVLYEPKAVSDARLQELSTL